MYIGKRRISTVLTAGLLAAGLSAAGVATATAATAAQAHAAVSHGKPARLDPFTGKPTTQYWTKKNGPDTQYYYYWQYAANTNYCAGDPGGVSGSALELLSGCPGGNNDIWTTVDISTGDWEGYSEIEDGDGLCIDDAGGANNVQILMEKCAVVGGQSWAASNALWLNAIGIEQGKPPWQAVTLDYGTVKNDAWIVTNNYSSGSGSTDMQWVGP